MHDTNPDLRHPHVLVVDDDPDTRELYQVMLEAVGYRVQAAATVRAASEVAAHINPQVVLTDWRLPDGDGFDVCDALRRRRASRRVPLVAVSGMSLPAATSAEAYARGFTYLLLKPASPDAILQAVRGANDIDTARRVRVAAVRLRRYARRAARDLKTAGARTSGIDASSLVCRAAARSGDNITIMLADDSARYVAAGGSSRDLTGYDPQELLSLSVWDLTPPADGAAGRGLWSAFIAAGTQQGRYILRRRDGAPVEAQYCAIANVIPGLHVSALAAASRMPASL